MPTTALLPVGRIRFSPMLVRKPLVVSRYLFSACDQLRPPQSFPDSNSWENCVPRTYVGPYLFRCDTSVVMLPVPGVLTTRLGVKPGAGVPELKVMERPLNVRSYQFHWPVKESLVFGPGR